MPGTAIVWFRRDLRLADHPALDAAVRSGRRIFPLYIDDPTREGHWVPGGASRWWLHHSLTALDAELRARGSHLVIRRGPAASVLDDLIAATGADALYWTRQYTPSQIAADRVLKQALRERGLSVESYSGHLLLEPWTTKTGGGEPYRIFSPYWRNVLPRIAVETPLPAPTTLPDPGVVGDPLSALQLLPRIPWDSAFPELWQPGSAGATHQLDVFLDDAAAHYPTGRDLPDRAGTSRLSPHLHFGEISPRQILHALLRQTGAESPLHAPFERHAHYLRELGWRDFAYHLLFHFPHTPYAPLYPQWQHFPWADDPAALQRWQRGQTGIPIIDAGMRQLWQHGWMHNRVRMIVASWLCKNLRQHWLHGARWFFDTLLDADLASNTLGWQWSAGCGADAAPYFRIFNPVTQGERFDPQGDYVRRYVPELSRLGPGEIHQPWKIGGVRGYPAPQVDLKSSREAALSAFGVFRDVPPQPRADDV